MRDDGGAAFAKPHDTHPNGNYEWGNPGMTYRDWLVGQMMARWWAKVTNLSPAGDFYMALRGDEEIREAVLQAHNVVDVMLKERNK